LKFVLVHDKDHGMMRSLVVTRHKNGAKTKQAR
jgi:hypothetical protein